MSFFGSAPQTGSTFSTTPSSGGSFFGGSPSTGSAISTTQNVGTALLPTSRGEQLGSVSSSGYYFSADDSLSGYHFVEVEPDTQYTITANRLEYYLDPAMWVFSGFNTFQDFLDSGTLSGDSFNYSTINYLAYADDVVPHPGPFSDPRVTITSPNSGQLTIVVTNFASGTDDGGDGRFDYEISFSPDDAIYRLVDEGLLAMDVGGSLFGGPTDTGGTVFGDDPDAGQPLTGDAPQAGELLMGSNPQSGDSWMGAAPKDGNLWFLSDQEFVLLDFEGIAVAGSIAQIPDGYGGGEWINGYVIDGSNYNPNSGYANVIQSGTFSGFNSGGALLTFTLAGDETFDLSSGYFAAAWNNDLTLVVEALRDGQVVGTADLLLDPQPAEIDFLDASADANAVAQFSGDFTGLDEVRISSSGGTNAGLGGGGNHFAMDDLVLITGVSQPEPDAGMPFWGFDA